MINLQKIKIWLGKRGPIIAVLLLAIGFFFAASSYNYFVQEEDFIKWLSPDETANYIFSKLYAQTGEMRIFEKYNIIGDGAVYPRSFGSFGGFLQPVSFLGLILVYGSIASLTTYKVLPFLTPLLGAIGLIFFYLLVKKIFGQKNALISVFLLAVFPPYFYYSARSMFHNVPFVVFLIIGLYFSLMMVNKKERNGKILPIDFKSLAFSAFSGLFFGLAVMTRASELIWIAPVLLVMWILNLKKIGVANLAVFISFFFLSLLPNLYWNQILYGGPFLGGYIEMNQSVGAIAGASRDLLKNTAIGELGYNQETFLKIKNAFFHFGFNPRQSVKMFYYYFVDMFPWIFWPAVFGFLLFLKGIRKWQKQHYVYLISSLIFSALLIFYYGSWKFNDNPNVNNFTIGNSYTRYWLPIYLASLPLASIFFLKLTKALFPSFKKETTQGNLLEANSLTEKIKSNLLPKSNFFVNATRVVIIAVVYFISIAFILFGSEEGLIYAAQNQSVSKIELEKVLALTENDAVIITRYHDKVFFPERKVIVGLFDNDVMNFRYSRLAEFLPLYYYNFTLPEKDLKYLNDIRLKAFSLNIKQIKKITNDFTLYKISPEKNETK